MCGNQSCVGRCVRRFVKARSGVAAIEFALLAPVLLLFVLGTFATSWAFHGVSSVNFALEQTSRTLQLNPNLKVADLQKTIDSKLTKFGKQPVTLSLTSETDAYGSTIAHVTAQYVFEVDIPFMTTFNVDYGRTITVILAVPV